MTSTKKPWIEFASWMRSPNRGAKRYLAWILRLPQITSVLCGASRPEQLVENCKALENLEFSDEELNQIDGALAPIKLPQSLWAKDGA